METDDTKSFLERSGATISVIVAAFICALMMWFFSNIHTQHIERTSASEDTSIQK